MSFSKDVKEELEISISPGRHCQLSELSAINMFLTKQIDKNTAVGKKFFTLQKKTNMLQRYVDAPLGKSCCKRAFLRGAFMSVGSVNDPNKSYNLEFVCNDIKQAQLISDLLLSFDVSSKISNRKNTFVVYIKEAESIVDVLNILGAHKSLMYMETLRVEKDVRNSINRKVNCETANIAKTVGACSKQIADIKKIDEKLGLDNLEEPLRQIAYARLEHESCSLAELGSYLNPTVGKSGVNHRLRKISEIAEKL